MSQQSQASTASHGIMSLLYTRPIFLEGKEPGHHFQVPWTEEPGLFAEGSEAGGVQTAKASRKQSSLSGKESAQGCVPQPLLGRPA